eukprot:350815-Chlamydomonas_euryale.AAC.5
MRRSCCARVHLEVCFHPAPANAVPLLFPFLTYPHLHTPRPAPRLSPLSAPAHALPRCSPSHLARTYTRRAPAPRLRRSLLALRMSTPHTWRSMRRSGGDVARKCDTSARSVLSSRRTPPCASNSASSAR